MGYTHYWYYTQLPQAVMTRISRDFASLAPLFAEMQLQLAGPVGTGTPIITARELAFNGCETCGHAQADLGIAWPAKHAASMQTFASNGGVGEQQTAAQVVAGSWFAGATLETRTCGGDCSHETFRLEVCKPAVAQHTSPYGYLLDTEKDQERFDCCKTAFKPYDLAVQCALIIAQHHARAAGLPFRVESDGEREHWAEAVYICADELGIGDFTLGAQ